MNEILSFQRSSDQLFTAGQPTREQFALVRDAGCDLVVNLATSQSESFLEDEREIVEALQMRYEPIPIVWDAPQLNDARRLFALLQENRDRRVFIHCAKNMRVSALMSVYRALFLDVEEDEARRAMHEIWTPNETWQTYIDNVRAEFEREKGNTDKHRNDTD